MKKRITAFILAAVCVLSLSAGAFAADAQTINATLDRTIKVSYNGTVKTFTDANGKVVYPIVYEGTTYLPVRAVSGLVSLPVAWDGASYTVVLGEGAGSVSAPVAPVEAPLTDSIAITPTLDTNIKVKYNGAVQSFTDANGKAVYPIVYEGTTYLPVRAVSGLVSLPVDWDGASYTVVLGEKPKPVFARGVWTNGVYSNAFAHIKFTMPEGWVYYSDEEMTKRLGAAPEGTTYDMMSQDIVRGTNITIMFEDISDIPFGPEDDTARMCRMYISLIKSQLSKKDGYTILGTDTIEISNVFYDVLNVTINEIPQSYYVSKVGTYMVCMIATGADNAQLDIILNGFSK